MVTKKKVTTSKKKIARGTIPRFEEKKVEPVKVKLPIIDGSQAVSILEENNSGIHYNLSNGTTTWVAK